MVRQGGDIVDGSEAEGDREASSTVLSISSVSPLYRDLQRRGNEVVFMGSTLPECQDTFFSL